MAVCLLLTKNLQFRNACYSTFKTIKQFDYKKYYKVLGIEEDSDQEQIRTAYLALVKRYHPDSGSEEANVEKFQEIDAAFKALINKKSQERWNVEEQETQEHDIKHTAPQHRQYLSYHGFGSGTPFERQKQYAKIRAMQANENVYQHRISKLTNNETAVVEKNPAKHKIKTKYGFDRLVEDLIQEAMSKGEFNNLSGIGKPLPLHQNTNPYVDFVTHKINEVLIDNGFTPEWIRLQKEIRENAKQLREDLLMERKFFKRYPLTVEENIKWTDVVYKYSSVVQEINKKIEKFNLVVPIISKQFLRINLDKEAQRAIKIGVSYEDMDMVDRPMQRLDSKREDDKNVNIFSFIDNFFRKKT